MISLELNSAGAYDLALGPDGRLADDQSLRTAVLVSLLTEARANPEDVPEGAPRGGWWGDSYPFEAGEALGSRLWVLLRTKILSGSIALLEQEITDRLQWLVRDGWAVAVQADIRRVGDDRCYGTVGITRAGSLAPEWVEIWDASL